tara:strand:+ start:153 stop:317 length:165 start_codon:yes stop_codon:yes gene_type:complete
LHSCLWQVSQQDLQLQGYSQLAMWQHLHSGLHQHPEEPQLVWSHEKTAAVHEQE